MSFLYIGFLFLGLILIALFIKIKANLSLSSKLRYIALILLTIALARPILDYSTQKEKIKSVPIVLSFDVSYSMRADDIKPNRLKATKEIIYQLLKRNSKDKNRVSLIAFTSNPLILTPFTFDNRLIFEALQSLKEKNILTKGTDLNRLIERVLKLPHRDKLLIIFTDGGDERIREEILSKIKKENLKILTIGMATKRGVPIKDDRGEFLRDKSGHIVISKLNRDIYRLGDVIIFSSIDEVLSEIDSWIAKNGNFKDIEIETKNHKELYYIPTILALILLFISSTKFIRNLVALFLLFGVNLEAFDIGDSYHLKEAYRLYRLKEYNRSLDEIEKIEKSSLEKKMILAYNLYRLKEFERSCNILKGLDSSNLDIKFRIFYNIGNCEAKLKNYKSAKSYYLKALSIKKDRDTLHNLKQIIFLKEKRDLAFLNSGSKEGNRTKSSSTSSSSSKKKANNKKSGDSSSMGNSNSKSKVSSNREVDEFRVNGKREFSSKAYELINEGYIDEINPW